MKSKDEIQLELASLLPSPAETSIQIEEHRYFLTFLTRCISIKSHNDKHSDLDVQAACYWIDLFMNSFKVPRKHTTDLYVKSIKTSLTEDQYFHFIEVMHSYRYSLTSAFLRDLITHQLDVKPSQSAEIQVYLEKTKALADDLSLIVEECNLVVGERPQRLSTIINELIDNLLKTRNLAVDAHNSQTARHLAEKYLDSQCLYTLYLDKLAQEHG
ncbi:chromosome segregation ATPase [Vibrio taketomensis]|uniref:chromosome segregation ATPase n=1 Tax=Vibrio taketomensis TaxID=2572923 RepID=UPI001389C484|nr:chromosome segregation ATPase [Vibrio taketomensis]